MEAYTADERAIALGHPSYVWRAGQERRLRMVLQHVDVRGKRVLDVGCGLGLYLERFASLGAAAYGVEIDSERACAAARVTPRVLCASAEALPYPDGYFDLVFSNEVLEHVQDDSKALREAVRVLAPGGILALFVPNRGYPFETHGIYWRGVYHFGNIPLVNYLPDPWRAHLCPHVRAYRRRDIRALFEGVAGRVIVHRGIFAGYDNIVARWPRMGRFLRALSYACERTPLQWLGLSHFVLFQKAA